jgi:hypothetical protein
MRMKDDDLATRLAAVEDRLALIELTCRSSPSRTA